MADFNLAIAVGPNVFRPDSNTLVELLIRIQSISLFSSYAAFRFSTSFVLESPIDPQDTQISHYLIATWAKVCQAMGPEFEPYLPVVMPSLLLTASAKADLSVYGTC
jgi:importin-5